MSNQKDKKETQKKKEEENHINEGEQEEEEEKICKNLGVTPDTVYLFVRGHHLADFISKVGQICTDKMLREQSETKRNKKKKTNAQIKSNKTFKQLMTGRVWIAKYFCMDMIKQDIKSFFYTKKK